MINIDEEFSFENTYNMIIPFSFEIDLNGEVNITCCKQLYCLALECESKLKDCSFEKISNELFNLINENVKPFAESNGFNVYEEDTDDYYYSFMLNDSDMINKSLILDSTIEIKENYPCLLSDYEIKSYLDDKLKIYGTVINGQLISAAAENLFDKDYSNTVEISVETNPLYTKKGYAASNICSLCQSLINDGKEVYYVCSHKNVASVSLAKKCGFALDKLFFAYCAYKE